MAGLDTIHVATLDDYDVVGAIAGWERIIRWASARQAAAIAALADRPVFAGLTVSRDGLDSVHAAGLEISARLQISSYRRPIGSTPHSS